MQYAKYLFLIAMCSVAVFAQGTSWFSYALSGTNVVPATISQLGKSGFASFNGGNLNFEGVVVYFGASAFEIHGPAPTGQNASLIGSLTNIGHFAPYDEYGGVFTPAGSAAFDSIPLTPSQASDLQSALLYLQVNSADFPNGQERGQLVPIRDPFVESSGGVFGPYAIESSASINSAASTIHLASPGGNARYYRLRSNVALQITNVQEFGGVVVISYAPAGY